MQSLIPFLRQRGFDPVGDPPPGIDINHVTEVSSQCGPQSVFLAIKGFRTDGHLFLDDAAQRGARVAIVTKPPAHVPKGMTLIRVPDTRLVSGPLAQFIAGNPSHKMDVLGVTGTNGKTTTSFMVEAVLKAAGRNPGLMGTVVNRWAGKEETASETTPSGPAIASKMQAMLADGVDSVMFEVSSHAIDQRRVDGIRFAAMALTNVTQDHLDYHQTMEEYIAVKKSVFHRMREENPDAVSVINIDDKTGYALAMELQDANRITFGTNQRGADLFAESIFLQDDGMMLVINFHGEKFELRTRVQGYFNAMNCLTAAGLGFAIGLDKEAVIKACENFAGAPGRFEMIPGFSDRSVVVDYAHTPDALYQLLKNARVLTVNRVLVVFGCGGDRDTGKRPLMGKAAAELADEIILTNDNPRSEDPQQIVTQIIEGILAEDNRKPFRVILDRKDAIRTAIELAEPGDMVVIAGKGHETYQIIGTEKTDFDDRETARLIIKAMLNTTTSETERFHVPPGGF